MLGRVGSQMGISYVAKCARLELRVRFAISGNFYYIVDGVETFSRDSLYFAQLSWGLPPYL